MNNQKAPETAYSPQKHTKSPTDWSGRTRGGYFGNWIFVNVVRFPGLRFGYALLILVTFYYLIFAPKAVRASLNYRKRINYGGKSFFARALGTYLHFYSFGKILLDRVAAIGKNADKFQIISEGEEHLKSAIREGKGLVLLSAHVGNWEIAAHMLRQLNVPVNVVAFQGEVVHIRRYFENVFQKRAFSIIEIDGSLGSSIEIMNALSRGEIVAMHGDRVIDRSGRDVEIVDFLGSPALFPSGPYLAAALTGAPLIHTFAVRKRIHKYHFCAYPPIQLSSGERTERRAEIRKCIKLFIQRLEETLKEHPLQWRNFFDFWAPAESSQEEKADVQT
jgi:predicted LPLAT superfamily acyltransferase